MSACSNDEPVEKVEAEPSTKEAPLPERQWYPRQKYLAQQPQVSQPQISQPQISQPQMMQQPIYSNSQPAQQQPWNGGYQVYQAPPVIIVQPQPQSQWYGSGTAGQVPEQQIASPQQYVFPYSQAPQRPWGVVPQTSQGTPRTYTTPSTGNQPVNPWSGGQVPPGGTMYPGWGGTPYGGYPPGIAAPGYVW